MAWNADGSRRPTCIFEAARLHLAIKPVCPCGHSSTFDPHGLWNLFERRGWNDSLREAKDHFWCRKCRASTKTKVRPKILETVRSSEADFRFPYPSDLEWKQALNRAR